MPGDSAWYTDRSPAEDRQPWYGLGNAYEQEFVETIAPRLGIQAQINPQKKRNPKAPDLIVNGKIAELKVRTQPFYTAQSKYGINPQYCVMFNRKDLEYYRRKYPHLIIFFGAMWQTGQTERMIGKYNYKVKPMNGLWVATLNDVATFISTGKKGVFGRNKWGDGADSYALNLRQFRCMFEE